MCDSHRRSMIYFDMHAIGCCVNGHYTDFINIMADVRCRLIHLRLQCCRVVMVVTAAAAAAAAV